MGHQEFRSSWSDQKPCWGADVYLGERHKVLPSLVLSMDSGSLKTAGWTDKHVNYIIQWQKIESGFLPRKLENLGSHKGLECSPEVNSHPTGWTVNHTCLEMWRNMDVLHIEHGKAVRVAEVRDDSPVHTGLFDRKNNEAQAWFIPRPFRGATRLCPGRAGKRDTHTVWRPHPSLPHFLFLRTSVSSRCLTPRKKSFPVAISTLTQNTYIFFFFLQAHDERTSSHASLGGRTHVYEHCSGIRRSAHVCGLYRPASRPTLWRPVIKEWKRSYSLVI